MDFYKWYEHLLSRPSHALNWYKDSTVKLLRLDTNQVVNVTISGSPHRDDVYYLKPEQLESGVTYKAEFDLPARVHRDRQQWSNTFTVTNLTLPASDLSIGIEAQEPYWDEYNEPSGQDGDCGPYYKWTRYTQIVQSILPTELEPWKDKLVWNVRIDDQLQENSPFEIQGQPSIKLRHWSCPNNSSVDEEKEYEFEAYIPGTQLSWRSNKIKLALNCPKKQDMDMSQYPDMQKDMHATYDMSLDMFNVDSGRQNTKTPATSDGCSHLPEQPGHGQLLWGLIVLVGLIGRKRWR